MKCKHGDIVRIVGGVITSNYGAIGVVVRFVGENPSACFPGTNDYWEVCYTREVMCLDGKRRITAITRDVHLEPIEPFYEDREQLAAAHIKASGKDIHASDCATSVAPAMEPGPCDCEEGSDAMQKE